MKNKKSTGTLRFKKITHYRPEDQIYYGKKKFSRMTVIPTLVGALKKVFEKAEVNKNSRKNQDHPSNRTYENSWSTKKACCHMISSIN